MTDKEFKRLGRAQLVDIIYQLQLQVDELTEQKQSLETALEDKRLRINKAGNIAEASLEINDCLRSAQNAAEQYLNEIRILRDETEKQCRQLLATAQADAGTIRAEAQAAADAILAKAKAEAKAIVADTKKAQGEYSAAVEAILKEYRSNDG